MVAALSIGEFQFSNLVAGFLNAALPVVLLQAFYGATGFACAATVILLVLALIASAAGALSPRGTARGLHGLLGMSGDDGRRARRRELPLSGDGRRCARRRRSRSRPASLSP